MKKFLYLILLLSISTVHAQNEVFESEVSHRNGLLYFKGKPLTGKLFSDDDNIPNKCYCTLEAQYKKGLLNGYKKTYYKNGKPKFSGKFVMGVKNGTHIYYYSNGKKKQVEKYVHGSLVEKQRYYKNGQIQKKEKFNNGKVISSILYNRDGSLKGSNKTVTQSTAQASKALKKANTHTVKVIPKKKQTKNNKPNSNAEIKLINSSATSNLSDGLQKIFYSNGLPKRISYYKDGLPVKDTLFYEETGNLQLVKKYNDGELIHLESYYLDKTLEKEENFLNNKKHGLQRYNYKNGQPQKIEAYEYGQLTHSEQYNENGRLLKEENYKFGKKHGVQKTFDKNGKLVELKEYDTGLLVKHERYTDSGKELIQIQNDLAEIKVFNKLDQMISLKYENVQTKQPDSLWITFDPASGEKLTEKAYRNGKLSRKGQYLHNKKNGEWITYWQNGKKETLTTYKNGIVVKTKTLTYAKQIKNNYTKGDIIFSYKTYLPKPKDRYVLIRFDSVQSISQKVIKKKILETIKNQGLKPVKDVDAVKEYELYGLMHFSNFNIKLKSKNNAGKKFVSFIAFTLKYQDFKTEKNFEKSYTITPATARKPKYSSHYTRDKKEAFYETLNNLNNNILNFVAAKFPLSGMIRKKTGSATKISEVYLNIGLQQGVEKGDYFDVLNDQGAIKARLKITTVLKTAAIARVEDGKEWLATYIQTHDTPLAIKSKQK